MNRVDRLQATLNGDTSIDRPPFSFWYHFGLQHMSGESIAAAHIAFARRYEPDFIKVMSDYSYPLKNAVSLDRVNDFLQLKVVSGGEGRFGHQLNALKEIVKAMKGETWVIDTIDSPWTILCKMSNTELVLKTARQRPEIIKHALQTVTQSLVNYIHEALATKINGIYFTVSETNYDQLTPIEHEELCAPFNNLVLEAASSLPFNILHLAGSRIYFETLKDYSTQAVTWAHFKTKPGLAKGLNEWQRCVLGGINQDAILSETAGSISAYFEKYCEDFCLPRLIVAPGDCLPPNTPPELLDAIANGVSNIGNLKQIFSKPVRRKRNEALPLDKHYAQQRTGFTPVNSYSQYSSSTPSMRNTPLSYTKEAQARPQVAPMSTELEAGTADIQEIQNNQELLSSQDTQSQNVPNSFDLQNEQSPDSILESVDIQGEVAAVVGAQTNEQDIPEAGEAAIEVPDRVAVELSANGQENVESVRLWRVSPQAAAARQQSIQEAKERAAQEENARNDYHREGEYRPRFAERSPRGDRGDSGSYQSRGSYQDRSRFDRNGRRDDRFARNGNDRNERPGYSDRPNRFQRDDRAPRNDRGDRNERPSYSDRPNRFQRDDRAPRNDRGDRNERGSYSDRPSRFQRDDRAPRNDRGNHNERGSYSDRPNRFQRDDRAPRNDRGNHNERGSYSDRPNRFQRDDRAPRNDRGERNEHRPQRDEASFVADVDAEQKNQAVNPASQMEANNTNDVVANDNAPTAAPIKHAARRGLSDAPRAPHHHNSSSKRPGTRSFRPGKPSGPRHGGRPNRRPGSAPFVPGRGRKPRGRQ